MQLWLRADASAQIGFGHVMRSLAIAEEALARNIDVKLVTGGLIELPPFAARIGVETAEPCGARWVDDVQAADVVVFDGYHFGREEVGSAYAACRATAAFDDVGAVDYGVDVVINPNAGAGGERTIRQGKVVLSGTNFAPVRRAFRERRRHRSGSSEVLLVTMGGSDPTGSAGRVVRALDRMGEQRPFSRVVVVQGPRAAAVDIEREWLVSLRAPEEPAAAFDTADAAIAAAGSTTWELLTMGMPVGLIEVAENQRLVWHTASAAGAALFVGGVAGIDSNLSDVALSLSREDRQTALSQKALSLADGLGPARVIDELLDVSR